MEKKLQELALKLLDLGKRNRLLNFKDKGYKTLEILNQNIESVFEKITSGQVLNFYSLDSILKKYNEWLNSDFISESDRKILSNMTDEEIEDSFSCDLEFGTAGIRGIMGELEAQRAKVAPYLEQDEDVLSSALFEQVAVKFFENRKNKKYGLDAGVADASKGVHSV